MKFFKLIVVICIFTIVLQRSTEQFSNIYNNNCSNCNSLSSNQCKLCANCGWCINKNSAKCISGDVNGPYYDSCMVWYHDDPWSRYNM